MIAIATIITLVAQIAVVQAWIPGDRHPLSPQKGGRGSVAFCYETTSFTTPVGVDMYNTALTGNITYGARTLPVSIWLPLPASEGTSPTGVATKYTITYNFTKPTDFLSSSAFVTYPGVAKGNCSKLISTKLATKAPLVILSHGQPGKKELWSAHAESLASKGYAVVAIDHTDSLWTTRSASLSGAYDQASMTSSLLNRRQDQLFIYDQIAALTTTVPATTSKLAYLYNNVDATKTSIVGYSFGGYGALLTAGATINPAFLTQVGLGSLAPLYAPLQTASTRPGIKAIVALAPWGNGFGVYGGAQIYNLTSLANIVTPTMVVVGDADDIAGYSAVGFTGVLGLFKGITNSVGRMLVTLKSVGHQIANNPAPADWLDSTDAAGWMHLNDQDVMTNVVQHFTSSFIEQVIKNGTTTTSTNPYFQVTPASGPDASGKITPKSIPGFSWRTVDGISINFS
ncbi:hypothetical protein HDU76_004580 [Blyttiomyces sp. JEL0837]|nr:hypothetical protein HDU76_004580 [Blyttiomyces sp. JEL0837]